MFRKFSMIVPVVAIAMGSTACATKKFVRTSVGEVNAKADSISRSLEETQERTRQNEAKINDVDQKAAAANTAATTAQSAADKANSAALEAANAATTTKTSARDRRRRWSGRHIVSLPLAPRFRAAHGCMFPSFVRILERRQHRETPTPSQQETEIDLRNTPALIASGRRGGR